MIEVTPTVETNPIARAIVAMTGRENWALERGAQTLAVSHVWPKSPAGAEAMTKAFGVEVKSEPRDYNDGRLAIAFLRDLVERGERMTRWEALAWRARAVSWQGMTTTLEPTMVLEARLQPIGYGPTRVPAVVGHVFDLTVSWFYSREILLEAQAPGEDGEVVELYIFAGCNHEFQHASGGNCYHIHTCKACGYRYDIDSGD